jgi:hypothetical protein
MAMKDETQFLNVDLDLRLGDGLEALLRFFEPSAFILHHRTPDASLELNDDSVSLEATFGNWVACVEALPPEAKALWSRCEMRRLNVGIQAGHSPHEVLYAIPSALVSSIARAQLEIAFTVYAAPTLTDR